MEEGKPLEAVAAVGHQLTGPHAVGLILGGELHQSDRAGGARLDAESHHSGLTVVTGIKTRMGTESFSWLERPVQQGDTSGLQSEGIESMGGTGLPKGQQLVPKAHHMGVGNVLEPQVKGIGQ